MMPWVIGASIRFRLLVLVGAAAVMFLGITQRPAATVDALPEFSPTYVEVQTEALGLSAAEVEQLTLMLGAFLYEWRTALISVVAIPSALVAAGLVLHWRGDTINTMILAGFVIALGDVVDDAIVDVENMVRRLREHRRSGSGLSTARTR